MTTLAKGDIVAGLYRVEQRISNREVYAGTRLADGRAVLISHLESSAEPASALQTRFGWAVEGLAPVLSIASARPGAVAGPGGIDMVMVEARPPGIALSDAPLPFPASSAKPFATALCRTAIRAREASLYLQGASPRVTYVELSDGEAYFTGLASRQLGFLASRQYRSGKTLDGPGAFVQDDLYVAPEVADGVLDPDKGNAYLVALLVTYATHGRHAFAQLDQFELMKANRPLPFCVPPTCERLLRAALHCDPEQRPDLDQLLAAFEVL